LLAALAGLGVVYGVQALDARFGLWATAGLDYSTHTSYGASLAMTISGWRRRWTLPLGIALAGYALLILVLRFHGPADVLAAAALAAPASWLAYRLLGPRTPPAGRELTREGAGDYDPTRA
jgi:hypothetical protein